MSWKSFVSAGLLCVLVSPAFAAPTVDVNKGGSEANLHLDADGNWVWRVRISQSNPPVDIDGVGGLPEGSPLAAELGFTASGSALLDANNLNDGFDTDNPGAPIWTWENYSDTNGDTVIDSTPPTDDEPVGLQSNCAGGLCTEDTPGDNPNTVFASLGSEDYLSDVDGKNFIEIIVQGPNTAQLSTTITMGGAYGGNGRIAELDEPGAAGACAFDSCNYDTYNGVFTRTAIAGDANLDGDVDDSDLSLVLSNWFTNTGRKWFHGNFDNQTNDDVDDADLSILLSHWFDAPMDVGPGDSGPFPPPGAGGGSAVPEPATMALLALAALGLAGLRGRRA